MKYAIWLCAIGLFICVLSIGVYADDELGDQCESSCGCECESSYPWITFLEEAASRTEVFYQPEEIHSPLWGLLTVQPLFFYGECRNVIFLQGQATRYHEREFYNLGLGYRYLFPDENWMVGINGFYDITSKEHQLQRFGLGLEFFTELVTFRCNYYEPLTESRRVSDKFTSRNILIERRAYSLRGIDAEVDLPLPYMPWARMSLGGFYFKGKQESSSGFCGNLRINLTRYMRLEGGRLPGGKHENNYFMLSISLGCPLDNEFNIIDDFFAPLFTDRNLCTHTLEKVRRQNDFVTKNHSKRVLRCPPGTTQNNGICVGEN